MYGEDEIDKIGLSDTLDNYTAEEIQAYMLCGCRDKLLGGNLGLYNAGGGSYDVWNAGTPFATGTVDYTYMHMFNGNGNNSTADLQGRYCGTVLLTDDLAAFPLCVTSDNIVNFKLITELDVKNYCMNISATLTQKGGIGATQLSDKTNTLYCIDIDLAALYYRYGTPPVDIAVTLAVVPYHVFDIGGELFLVNGYKTNKLGFSCRLAPNRNAGMEIYPISSSADDDSYSLAFNNLGFGDDYSDYESNTYAWAYGYDTVNKFGTTDAELWYQCYFGILMFDVRYYYKNYDQMMMQFANTGLFFKVDGVIYKPLISDNVVYGYTDNLDAESDIDNWERDTKHDIPVTPPTPPPPPGPYDDDPWHGVSFSGVGVGGAGAFAKCYYMTSTELANLRSWMNSNNVPEGFDPMQQIIGLSQVPVNLSGDDNTTVQFVNSSAVYDPGVTRLVDSGVSTQISMGTPKRYSLGSVNITRRMQERGEPYLDYDCQIELYLPLIGMFSLDTQAVMGRTITAEAVLDPISGTLAAYAYVTRDGQNLPIAYGSTTIGVDLPISAQQYSVARAALKQANAQLGTSLLSSTLSLIAAATAGGKGSGTGAKTATGSTNGLAAAGIREAGADYMKASQAGNVFGDFMQWGRTIRQLSYGNNTAIAGSFGGSTAQWSYPFTPYVKIIRPRYEKPRNYNRSQGVPCVQTKTVGSCTGFIQCIGVEVKGITGATDIELQAIQAALTNGVFAGGGS